MKHGDGRRGVGATSSGAKSPSTSLAAKEAGSWAAPRVLFKYGFNVCKYGLIRSLCNDPSASDPPLQSRRQFV